MAKAQYAENKKKMKHPLRSAVTTTGRRMAGARSLWRANGMREEQFGRPVIGIANSFTQFVPGHVHLKDLGQLDDGHPPASGRSLRDARSYRVGDRVGIFRIRHLSDTEVVMGQDDKHLDVQVSICKQPAAPGTAPRVVLSTVVHIHNTLGHAYMAVITPIHRVIARGTAQRLADHGKS